MAPCVSIIRNYEANADVSPGLWTNNNAAKGGSSGRIVRTLGPGPGRDAPGRRAVARNARRAFPVHEVLVGAAIGRLGRRGGLRIGIVSATEREPGERERER